VPKGYLLHWFGDAFARYLSTSGGTEPLQRYKPDGSRTTGPFQTATPHPDVAVPKGGTDESANACQEDVCTHCRQPGGKLEKITYLGGPVGGVIVHLDCADAWYAQLDATEL
jgi:hypothetical protein